MSVNVVDNNVTVTASQEVEVANELVTNTITNEYPNTITVKSNEFAVVGDALFATTKEEVPGWMRELVGDLARSATTGAYNAMTGFNYNLYNAMIALQVAENKYQQAINTRVTDQEAFVQAVETLNSTVQNAEAEIVGIKQTYATKDFAVTTVAQTLEASLNGGAIKSSLGQLASTMTNQYGTMAQRMDVLESTFEDLELGVEGYANATNTLETYVGLTEGAPDGTGLLAKVEILERQNDGVIETVTGTYDVMLNDNDPLTAELVTTAEPYNSWKSTEGVGAPTGAALTFKVYRDTTTDTYYQYDGSQWVVITADIETAKQKLRLAHVGDVYIKVGVDNSYVSSYKFIKAPSDTTSPYSTDEYGFTWATVVDQAAQAAYELALDAYDMADGKRRVFTATPVGPYDVGDLWARVVGTSNQIWRANTASTVYNAAHWQVASTDDTAVIALSTGLANGTATVKLTNAYVGEQLLTTYLGEQLDSLVVVYSGTDHTTQTGMEADDIYIESTTETSASGVVVDVVNTYKYNGTNWVQINNNSNITALADLADGKRSIYGGNTVPTGAVVNDMWIPSADNGSYVKGEVYQYIGDPLTWTAATKYTEDLDNFVDNVYTPVVTGLQSQVDGKIESWYTLSTDDPKAAWTTTEERTKHDGDLWYQIDTKNSYYYSSGTHSWNTIEDSTAIAALEAAGEAQATADGVVVSYYAIEQSTAPTTSKLWLDDSKLLQKFTTAWEVVPVKEGDTLTTFVTATSDSKVYVYNGTSWVTETAAGVVASSKAVTDLKAYLEVDGQTVGGTSTIQTYVEAKAEEEGARVESKFAYNSSIVFTDPITQDKFTYDSGFGLATSVNDSNIPVGNSEFWINADKFKMTTTGYNGAKYSPFSVDGTNGAITFNGKVSFSSITGVPDYVEPAEVAAAINNNTTTIDGAKITTGTIQAGAIAAGAITADKVSADVFSGQTIIGGNIYGTRIEGASILGAVIKSSWIDYSNTGVLTNWQHFTPATVPSQYVGNFAKNTDGSLVVDSLGYVRLPGSNVVRTPAHSQNLPYSYGSNKTLTPFVIPLLSYDYYQEDTPNRYIDPNFVLDGTGQIYLQGGDFPTEDGYGDWYGNESAKATFYVGNVKYEVYCYEYNSYDLTGYVKENNVTIGTTNWHRNGSLIINKTPYGIPVTINVNYNYAVKVTITIGANGSFVSGYTGSRNLVNVVEAWSGNSRPEYRTAASTDFGIFTAHV